MKRVLLGYSGGVDSTAAALELQQSGYDVHLETFDLNGNEQLLGSVRKRAELLGLTLQITNLRDQFQAQVIDYFCHEYLQGRTPAPCTRCNVEIKWKTLYLKAIREGYDHIATGHYLRICEENGIYYVHRGVDPLKDQSYYLWGVPQEYLSRALTPMGEKIKSEIKAQYQSQVPARESMGVCFLEGINYCSYLQQRFSQIQPGAIINQQGIEIGTHDGVARYTIGQQKHLHTALEGAVVIGIEASKNQLIVGLDSELYHDHLVLKKCHVPCWEQLLKATDLTVKIRGLGRNPAGRAVVEKVDPEHLVVRLTEPAWAAAPGQPVVLYAGDRVVGGGFLEQAY